MLAGPGPGKKYVFSFSTSWLYSYYFGGDSAQLLTIGKAWYLGKLTYVDMFDHKGPFIFYSCFGCIEAKEDVDLTELQSGKPDELTILGYK